MSEEVKKSERADRIALALLALAIAWVVMTVYGWVRSEFMGHHGTLSAMGQFTSTALVVYAFLHVIELRALAREAAEAKPSPRWQHLLEEPAQGSREELQLRFLQLSASLMGCEPTDLACYRDNDGDLRVVKRVRTSVEITGCGAIDDGEGGEVRSDWRRIQLPDPATEDTAYDGMGWARYDDDGARCLGGSWYWVDGRWRHYMQHPDKPRVAPLKSMPARPLDMPYPPPTPPRPHLPNDETSKG